MHSGYVVFLNFHSFSVQNVLLHFEVVIGELT